MGQGALYGMGLLRFWKGKMFVRMMAEKETAESKAAVMALGKKIAEPIPDKGKKPALLGWIPSEGLHTKLIPYFHKPVILNIQFYLADANILNLNEKTEAVPPKSIEAADAKYRLGTSDPSKIKIIRLGWEKEMLL